jgi:hypothetical protein
MRYTDEYIADVTAYVRDLERAGRAADDFGDKQSHASLAARRMALAADEAGDKAAKAQRKAAQAAQAHEHAAKQAADAVDKLARGEIKQAEAARLQTAAQKAGERAVDAAGRAMRELERADIAQAAAAQASARATDQQADQMRQLGRSADRATRGLTANRGTLMSLIAAGGLAAAGAAAAGVAFGAFGVVAAGSVAKVVSAQQDLVGSWDTLSTRQKAAAVSVRALTDDYKALAKSYEPQALAAFNGLVGTARGLLPRLGSVINATSGDMAVFTSRIASFVDQRVGGEFLSWTGRMAPQALDILGDTMTTAGDTALDLLQDIAPLGLSVLQMTNGVLKGVNALADFNPLLAQFAVSAVALRAPVTGIVSGATDMAGRLRTAGAAAEGAAKSSRLLNLVTAAGPNLYVAAGVALGFLAIKALTAKTGTDKLIDSMRVSYKAVGNNLVGHQQLAAALARRIQTEKALAAVSVQANTAQAEGAGLTGRTATATEKLTAAHNAAVRAYNNVMAGATQLSKAYDINTEQATRLADAAGVNLATSMDKSGHLTAEAAAKIAQYEQAVQLANDPTQALAQAWRLAGNSALLMEDRVKALSAALELHFNPSLAVYKLTGQLKSGYRELISALGAAKGRLDDTSDASKQARQAFTSQLETVRDLYLATAKQTKSNDQASASVRNQLPVLYALAGHDQKLRSVIDGLATDTHNLTGRTDVSRQAFAAAAHQMGISRGEATRLWHEYQKVPRSVNTTIKTNSAAVKQAIRDLQSYINRLHGKTIANHVTTYYSNVGSTAFGPGNRKLGNWRGGYIGYADGGPVQGFPTGGPVTGPGTGISDSIPAWLSNGEYVINAAATRMFRPVLDAINYGRARMPTPTATAAPVPPVVNVYLNIEGNVTTERKLIDAVRQGLAMRSVHNSGRNGATIPRAV